MMIFAILTIWRSNIEAQRAHYTLYIELRIQCSSWIKTAAMDMVFTSCTWRRGSGRDRWGNYLLLVHLIKSEVFIQDFHEICAFSWYKNLGGGKSYYYWNWHGMKSKSRLCNVQVIKTRTGTFTFHIKIFHAMQKRFIRDPINVIDTVHIHRYSSTWK